MFLSMCSNDDYHPGCRSAICLAVIVLLGVSPVVAQEASEKEVKSAVSSGMSTAAVLDIRDEKVRKPKNKRQHSPHRLPVWEACIRTTIAGPPASFSRAIGMKTNGASSVSQPMRISSSCCVIRLPKAKPGSTGISRALSFRQSCQEESPTHGT